MRDGSSEFAVGQIEVGRYYRTSINPGRYDRTDDDDALRAGGHGSSTEPYLVIYSTN